MLMTLARSFKMLRKLLISYRGVSSTKCHALWNAQSELQAF